MPNYSIKAFKWKGFDRYEETDASDVTIDDDDENLDWFGEDTGTQQTATIDGTTYTVAGAGMLKTKFENNEGSGKFVSEDLMYMNLTGYGWAVVPMPESQFGAEDKIVGFQSGWKQTDGIAHKSIACFTAGSFVETPVGRQRIERLEPGDLVWTHDAGTQPVLFVGKTKVDRTQLVCYPGLRPVVFARGSFESNSPDRDMAVSPQHLILLSDWRAEFLFGKAEVLVPAGACAAAGLAHIDNSCVAITYIHILLPGHHLVRVDGMISESLYPAGREGEWIGPVRGRNSSTHQAGLGIENVASRKLVRQSIRFRDALALANSHRHDCRSFALQNDPANG